MPAQPIDLNALFAEEIEENRDNAKVIEIEFGPEGQIWHLTNSSSQAALLNAGKDPMGWIKRMVIPSERDAFEQMLVDMDGMTDDVLVRLINKLAEVLAKGVPTGPSSASAATSPSRTSGTRSKAT